MYGALNYFAAKVYHGDLCFIEPWSFLLISYTGNNGNKVKRAVCFISRQDAAINPSGARNGKRRF
tara:strand:+ start:1063 stop:1257 length:195 start_codon:yes stop_codon:yes gene_type:complete